VQSNAHPAIIDFRFDPQVVILSKSYDINAAREFPSGHPVVLDEDQFGRVLAGRLGF
jgi:hypothetical protein